MRKLSIKYEVSRIKHMGGFTLLELLVVIGIIGLLMGIAAVSYTAAQGKTRDSRRKQDMKSIQAAMEQAYSASATSVYPVCVDVSPPTNIASDGSTCAIATYFSASVLPVDPGTHDYYFNSSSASAYEVCALLEDGTTEYCLESLQ